MFNSKCLSVFCISVWVFIGINSMIVTMLHFLLTCTRLRKNTFILRCAAILLILVFSQKSGAGLFVHNLFHSSNEKKEEKGTDISYACFCIDDFLMPFAEADGFKDPGPAIYPIIHNSAFEYHIPFHKTIYTFFRGPPSIYI